MEEWKEYTIDDICKTIFAGGDAVKYNPTKNKTEENNIPIYANSVDNEGLYGYCSKPLVTEPAVTVAARGAGTGFVCYRKYPYVPIVRLLTLIPNRNVDAHFLYYRLKKNFIKGDGSAIPQLTVPMIKKEKITLPSLVTQQKIANILSSLDDKIEVNRRINEQLEELAQALFKSWFVDFEPFKDGEFVESELGMIPKGWKVGTLGDIALITKGTTPTTLGYSFTNNGIPFIKAESIRDNHTIDFDKITYISSEANEKLCRSIINKYDILFTIAGTLGRFCFAPQTLEIANTNQAVAIIRVHKLFNPISIYSMLLGKWHTEYCYRNIQQAVQANLSLGTLKKMPILIPPFDIIKKYEESISPIFMKFESLNEEITHLTTLRDTLLPKLMSGEIDVNEVEL